MNENFCPSCVAVPMAMAGAGLGMTTSSNDIDKKQYTRDRIIMLGVGLAWTVIVLFIGLYFMYFKKCEECR